MRRFLLLIPLVVIAILILAWSQRRTGPITVSGYIEAHDVRLGSRVGGRVEEVLADEGRTVKTGDVLLRFEAYDLKERLAEAQASKAAQAATLERLMAGFRKEEKDQARAMRDRYQAVLDKLQAGTRPTEMLIAKDKVALAEAEAKKAEYDIERVRKLFQETRATEDELAEETRASESAQARLSVARDEFKLAEEGPRKEDIAEASALLANAAATLAMMEAGSRKEEIAEAQAMLAAATSRVAAIERQIAELEVRSPCDGVIDALSIRPGDMVGPGGPVLTMLDNSTLWVRTYVPQNRVGIQVGQKLPIRVDAFPGRMFDGRVTFVARDAEFTPTNAQTPEERSKQVFRVKVEIEGGRDVLRAGMAADVVLESR